MKIFIWNPANGNLVNVRPITEADIQQPVENAAEKIKANVVTIKLKVKEQRES